MIRTAGPGVAAQGRDATGVRVMNLDDGQTVAAVAAVADEATRAPSLAVATPSRGHRWHRGVSWCTSAPVGAIAQSVRAQH